MLFFRLFVASLFFFFTLAATELRILEKIIQVKGKQANIYTITQPNGYSGIKLDRDQPFKPNLPPKS